MTQPALQLLQQELAALRGFVELLLSEQKALLDNDTDALLSLSDSKTLSANQIMEMAKQRRSSLLVNGIENMETWLAKFAPQSLPQWEEVRKLAAEAQHLNTTNGELISAKMRNNQQTLNVLFSSAKNAANLYGPDGQANLNSTGRHLGSG
jgi:flagellar biosynthesis/type III secretory pathway chaperone